MATISLRMKKEMILQLKNLKKNNKKYQTITKIILLAVEEKLKNYSPEKVEEIFNNSKKNKKNNIAPASESPYKHYKIIKS